MDMQLFRVRAALGAAAWAVLACLAGACSSDDPSSSDGAAAPAAEVRTGNSAQGSAGHDQGRAGAVATGGAGGASGAGVSLVRPADPDRGKVGEPEVGSEWCDLSPLETWRAMNNASAPNPKRPIAIWLEQRMRVVDLEDFSVHAFDPCANRWEQTLPAAPELAKNLRTFRELRFTGRRFYFQVTDGVLTFDPISGAGRLMPTPTAPDFVPASEIGTPSRTWNGLVDGRYDFYWSGTIRADTLAVLKLTDDAFYFDFDTAAWSEMGKTGAPAPRYTAALDRHGDELVVFGGFVHLGVPYVEPAQPISDGGIYDMSTRTWSAIASEGAPTQCAGNMLAPQYGCMRAFWNGTRLLAYAPMTGNNSVLGGGIYDVAARRWQAMAEPPFTLIAQAGGEQMTERGNLFYIVGTNDLAHAQLALLDLERNAWRAIEPEPPPHAPPPPGGMFTGFVQVWTGKTLIRWLPKLSVNTSCLGNIPSGAICDPAPPTLSQDPGVGFMLTIDEPAPSAID